MSERWADALATAQALQNRERDRWVLWKIAQLPFLSEEVLEQLAGVTRRGLYPRVNRLTRSRLVGAIAPSLVAGHNPRLLYLTDLGVATTAVLLGVEPEAFACRTGVSRRHLIRLIPKLSGLQATYRLLGAFAAILPQPASLQRWEQPWRHCYFRPTTNTPSRVQLPAFAAFAVDGRPIRCLLVSDQGLVPMRSYRSVLNHLLAMRTMDCGSVPMLVVATEAGRRMRAWEAALQETAENHREAPLSASIANWSDLRAGLRAHSAIQLGSPVEPPSDMLSGLPRLEDAPASRRLPKIVGSLDELDQRSPQVEERLAWISLAVSPSDRQLLDLLGRHPFLSNGQLAVLIDRPIRAVRSQCRQLASQGLVRTVGPEEVRLGRATSADVEPGSSTPNKSRTGDWHDLAEVTETGLALVAAQRGLRPKSAARLNGLVGGGPGRPVGAREQLLRQMEHTVQANNIFVNLVHSVRLASRGSHEDTVVTWRSAAASARGALRPDWYAVVDHGQKSFGFFLEYDRGTESARDYRRKFAAYYAYLFTRRFERDYEDFPMVLVVTTDNAAERRIADAAERAAVGRELRLPLFLTSEWRITDKTNSYGLLGPIWREPGEAFDVRHALPLPQAAIHMGTVPSSRPHVAYERS
jgi:hypothetical protein